MRLRYTGAPGAYVDIETRTKWKTGDVREVPTSVDANRLLGSGLFEVEQDAVPSENKMESGTRRKTTR